jgi:1-acyl-sn-glycerol-3-phosphate acyltransferase
MVNTRKDIRSFRSSIQEQPAIIITNHASFIDILAMLMISPNVVMMTNRWVWNSPFFGRVVRYAGYLRREDGVEVNTERVREAMAQGLSVIIFPEGTRSLDGTIGRFHKGAFHIAEALQAPIIPVILHGFGMAMGKNDALLKNPLLTMRTLPAIQPGDPRFGVTVKERTKSISNWFKAQYKELKTARETPSWFHEQLLRNYMYKGPVLEWHTRVKLRMDRVLHELLHARIPRDARIVDLGSGHGMVTFLLQWSAPDRVVSGFERDPDKVELARHMYSANERTSFETADLENFAPPPADAYILKDVLHYLPLDQQRRLLLACADALEPEGSIYVRDGFDDTGERHRRTTWTERLSTGIGFNRTKGPLQYMTKTMFTEMAMEAGLKLEWSLKEERTSNELVILSKA